MHAVNAGYVVGVDCREHTDAQLVAPELAVYGSGVDDSLARNAFDDRGGVDRIVEVDRPDHTWLRCASSAEGVV